MITNDYMLSIIAQARHRAFLEEVQIQRTADQLSQGKKEGEMPFFWQGYRATMPLLIGVAPFGLVFGALAVAVGITPLAAVGMSLFVLAGSSQFIAAELIGEGASILLIILTTFLINLRHFFYSASLAPSFRSLSKGWKGLLAYVMVDEVYATVIARHQQKAFLPKELGWFFIGASTNLVSVWLLTTALGTVLGNILPPRITETLGFTLPLIFISLVIPLLVTRPALLAALSATLVGIVLAPLPHQLGLLVAAGVGIFVGAMTEKRQSINMEQKSI